MSLLVPKDFERHIKIIKHSVFNGHYPLLVRACFASALPSNTALSRTTLLKATQLRTMVNLARDPRVKSGVRLIVSKYLLAIKAVQDGSRLLAKVEEQHTFQMSLLAQILYELENYHGGEHSFNQRLAQNHGHKDVNALIKIVQLT
ncbi:hypothetical protein KW429_11260 [Vibrio fluvialis]|nr:hypothetical protein [Vibrio fluvialis]MBY7902435.1 hypothetical protein [Vibrio fluvialis]